MRLYDLDEIKLCVDRQYENCHGYFGNKKTIYREAILAVKSILHSVKPIDAVPVVHGRWIYKGDSDMWVCSRCGRGVNADPEGIDLYCYHCGAKMDKKENDNDC